MKKDEKEGLIGLVIIVAVLLVGGYFIYKIFFTYSSYSECVADRTMKSGMSDLQVVNQKKYCRQYFAKKLSKKEIREREKKAEQWIIQNKGRIEKAANRKCVDPINNWLVDHSFILDNRQINCNDYKYLDKN